MLVLELFDVLMAISMINLNYLLISLKQCNAFISHHDEKQKVDLCFKLLLSWDSYFRDLLTSTEFYSNFRGVVTLGTLGYFYCELFSPIFLLSEMMLVQPCSWLRVLYHG